MKEEMNFFRVPLVKFRSILSNYVTPWRAIIFDTVRKRSKLFVSFLRWNERETMFSNVVPGKRKKGKKRGENGPISITKMINVYRCEFITTRKQWSNWRNKSRTIVHRLVQRFAIDTALMYGSSANRYPCRFYLSRQWKRTLTCHSG